ncbi:CDP-alcohol phosphatidyltransferase family protein [Candidatus Sumerlaeota bacterium]|nr:CDP-alcohol phosphatidyltransferase family protein [Candidatus Sumerlaeota bacterium]
MRTTLIKYIWVMSLTIGRLPLILVFLAVSLWLDAGDHPIAFSIAFCAAVLSAVTDLLDGYFARKFNLVTRLGGSFDPVIDKVFFIVTLPTLVYRALLRGEPLIHCRILVLIAVILLARDQWLTFLREICARYKVDSKASWIGKIRTTFLFVTICTVYWFIEVPDGWWLQLSRPFIYFLEAVGLGLTLLSIWTYTRRYGPYVLRELFSTDGEDGKGALNSGQGRGWRFILITSLTAVRFPLILGFLLVNLLGAVRQENSWLLVGSSWHTTLFSISLAILIVCALTDLFDGYLARKFRVVTQLGKHGDPLADNLYFLVTLTTFVFLAGMGGDPSHGGLLLVLAVVSLSRDQLVSLLVSVGAMHGAEHPAGRAFQARAFLTYLTVCCVYEFLLFSPATVGAVWRTLALGLESACIAVNLLSIVADAIRYWPYLRAEVAAPLRSPRDADG